MAHEQKMKIDLSFLNKTLWLLLRPAEGEEREGVQVGGSGGGSGEGRRGARSEEVAAGGGIESRTEVRAGIGRGKRCRE